jgi:hypothetical protein
MSKNINIISEPPGGTALMARVGRVERLQIMLSEEELVALDDWRFARRMPSRASAIRELLKRGLAAEGFKVADKDVRSKQFGVLANAKRKTSTRDETQ